MKSDEYKPDAITDEYKPDAITDEYNEPVAGGPEHSSDDVNSFKKALLDHTRELVVLAALIALVLIDSILISRTDELTESERGLLTATVVTPTPPTPPMPPVPVEQKPKQTVNPYMNLNLEAKSAVVFDLTTDEVLFEKNSRSKLPLASVTKLMTSLLVSELLPPDAIITITAEAVKVEGDSGLIPGEEFRRQDLSDFSLVSSSNDAAYALAEAAGNKLVPGGGIDAFVQAMNIRAGEIGLSDTSFQNPTGLDQSLTESGGLGSAFDIAKLLKYIATHNRDILEGTTKVKAHITGRHGSLLIATNTNDYISVPGLIGSKTGFTNLAGGNLAIIYDAGLNHLIAVVVLNSSRQGRFIDVEALVTATNGKFSN